MQGRFANKVVIVTGASSSAGIGAASARRFVEEGARVAVVARGAAGLDALVEELRARGGDARAFPADLTDIDACERLIQDVISAFGGIDVLVNNAGANTRGPLADQDHRALANVLQINLVAPVVLTRLALPALRARGGAIVQVASIAGQFPLAGEATYSASKFGLRAFTFALREELEGTGVRLAVVSPGPVETGFLLQELDHVPDLIFAQPMSSADQVAELVVASAVDGRRERTIPVQTGILARLGAALPPLRRALVPLMETRGRVAKEAFRVRHGRS
ncbi:SDR family NAD(P)-dependent oxidoreductase [Chondromyces crocatus]|uniref:Short-chain dehydrogenase n=1 Tax=Chondromyces crocatus TaxID=52 RepID=A0A0K1ETN2_CHOCO|nr:SDR family oxidoreductase [Chondromyces crocatus]AKT44144.1 short-chain dehydrogenase [Chondromyces crocatus]